MEELTPWQGNVNDGPSRRLATLSSKPFVIKYSVFSFVLSQLILSLIKVYSKSIYLKFNQVYRKEQ
jgi:hypothetical protein